ncbi:hypothetical protein [Leptospira meyeri]|uniref:hypothetical protein n=1 Tax=Leptospira meyeri TaxID=29508 RepID=UPI0002BDFB3A|nr:hypothetical protein [Leptospira meyeri]PKA24771.1 hypothetical protein CH381_19025 [Leptospira sp. mixed culture ATI2-C-A1]EMJ85956.1 hypothetical protein LEP1GSC196_0031 [Leptospira meyeri serovar Semaranga str. Veldrot Semarang 173]MCW7489484.1 hypothetical protein [Leptospira meyeri]PJZ82234.1 hypothetical protein CH359_04710 [Leptospira meyeri]PJZ97737.1 hypothetical protein CH358_01750 [Leptospira meyeri]
MKLLIWVMLPNLLICVTLGFLFQCTAVDKKTYLKGFYHTLDRRPHGQLAYAEKHGYNSECLVLMEGPVPSRMEPCSIGDRRSGRDMYQESEVIVAGDFFPIDWSFAGYGYELHVTNETYQSIVFFSSYSQRRGPSRFSPWYYRRDMYGTEVKRYNPGYPYRITPFYAIGR